MTVWSCFFCGVDSTDLIIFLGLLVGSGVAGLICFILWGIATGHLAREDELAGAALDAEGDDLVPLEEIP